MLRTSYGIYNGDSWEEHCQTILKMKYESDGYQEMIAHTNGDLGIEGFTRTGIVFQCYCPDDEYDPTKLYEHQRDKVTKDLKKLATYKEKLLEFFQGIKIKKWIFLTPKVTNKQLVAHCHTKAHEYRDYDEMRDLLDEEFDVLVHDEEFYAEEIIKAKRILNEKVNFNVSDPKDEEIINWKECKTSSIEILNRKLSVLFDKDDNKVNRYIDFQIRNYIKGQQILSTMQ
ncbi:hypothetical protein MOE20_19495 [Bacillus atrophaeus]|uniref:hypothetical protein n=1 Tax=Bacillus atrophaeus TaxID=1452 RepID=UPI002282FF67|nr:hypothetical protein [Bacillus atrophaeus]MCY8918568.1 hypothetical protein [Bacillus atrophaeus]MCY8926744.1 hypothetical protein [Bacillus atrophaeus]